MAQASYEFGPYRVDLSLCRLFRGTAAVPLAPKAFDLLLLFVRNPNRVLSKSELIQALWPDTFVNDANLTQHVFTLRKALGASYIQTAARRGYVFIGSVSERGDLPEAARPPAEVSVDAERKQATVLDCAVANTADLAERLGPVRLDALLRSLAEAAAEETARYEGVFQTTRPDAFEAVFGAPVVHEDDPWRAVLTAFAVQRAAGGAAGAGARDGEQPVLRIGIATGPVIVTRRVSGRGVVYSTAGEASRVAALLQQQAAVGTILIGEETRQAVEGFVTLDVAVASGGEPAFRITGTPAAPPARPPRLQRALEPFLGRVHELGLLADIAARAHAGLGQVVTIVGDPGIGKSRLVLEFIGTLTDARILESRCLSYGSLVPYLPLADLARQYCGIRETSDVEAAVHAVRGALAGLALPADADTRLLGLLGVQTAAAATISPEAIKVRTFDVLRALLTAASAERTLVIVVEDVHWIDRTSEQFFAMFADRIAASRVLIVVTCRPGYQPPWRDRSYAAQITLTPLTRADSEALIGALARDARLPPPVFDSILARADGNPFFLGELTRAAREHGPDHAIPATVHGVIMARLDRLPDASKQLLQTAAVIGREVPRRLLTRIRRAAPDVDDAIAELCRLEFLYERPTGDEPTLVFKHALTQDVAYDSLLARQRSDLHLETARALEELYAGRIDEMAATLAYHYARTDVAAEAITWLTRTADRAARVYATAEAILHLDLARRQLERLPPGPDRDRRELEVALRHAHALYFVGRWQESVETLRPYSANLSRLNDSALTATYSFWLAHMYTRLGDQRLAADYAHRAIEAGTRAGDWATVGKAHGALALDAHWSGNAPDGIAHGTRAVRILRSHADQRWWLGMAHCYLAMNHVVTGDFDAAIAEAARARSIGEAIADPRLQTYAGFVAAWVEASQGHGEQALAFARHSRDQAPDRVSYAFASTLLGYALIATGDARAAREQLEPLIAEFESFGFPQWQGWAAVLAADACRLQGDVAAARSLLDLGLTTAARACYWYAVASGERVAARLGRDSGRTEESAAAYGRALETFRRIGARFEERRTRDEAARLVMS